MTKYRGHLHRKPHPKIYVWSHTAKAEIEYFQSFKNHLGNHLLMPQKKILFTPQALIGYVVDWKQVAVDEADGDQVWCIFDVDDFFQQDRDGMLESIELAHRNGVRIAYINECFELWILLHFELPTSPVSRGEDLEKKIQSAFKKEGLGEFIKNKNVFDIIWPYHEVAITNARKLLGVEYADIDWKTVLSKHGNSSTSIHFLIAEIKRLLSQQ